MGFDVKELLRALTQVFAQEEGEFAESLGGLAEGQVFFYGRQASNLVIAKSSEKVRNKQK